MSIEAYLGHMQSLAARQNMGVGYGALAQQQALSAQNTQTGYQGAYRVAPWNRPKTAPLLPMIEPGSPEDDRDYVPPRGG